MRVNDSLGEQPQFVYDETGKITGYTTKIGGADTVFPFSSDIDVYFCGTMNYYCNGANAHNCGWGLQVFNPHNLELISEGSDKSGSVGYVYVTLPKGKYSIALSNVSSAAYMKINDKKIIDHNNQTTITLENTTNVYFYISKSSSGTDSLTVSIIKL